MWVLEVITLFAHFTVVGTDACIRTWLLRTGELARCVEQQEYGFKWNYPLPTVCYSETLGGQQFNPSLLICINNRMVQFSTQFNDH